MSLPPELVALRDEAMLTTCHDWAIKQMWPLKLISRGEYAGPCPVCGGDDRFSINTTKDVWQCRFCGIGGGIILLVEHTENLKFVAACERITGRVAAEIVDPEHAAKMRAAAEAKKAQHAADAAHFREKSRQRAEGIWKDRARPPAEHDPVVLYLKLRGIPRDGLRDPRVLAGGGVLGLRQIRYLDYLTETITNGKKTWHKLHNGAAMVAKITRADGEFGGIHQTWIDLGEDKGKVRLVHPTKLDRDGQPEQLPAKKVSGEKKGGAIRLFTPPNARRMVAGEGLETTLTPLVHAFQEHTAYWCTVDLGNMAGRALRQGTKIIWDQPDMADLDCFLPPDWVEELVYLTDGDDPEKHTTEKVICGLRRARRHREIQRQTNPNLAPLAIFAASAGELGKDFNDLAMVERDEEGQL